jgi:hypothetical protein
MNEMGGAQQYGQGPLKDQSGLYAGTPQNQHRVSAFSEHGGSPVPPYSGGGMQQGVGGPMELDGQGVGSPTHPQPIYEAPEGAPRT